MHAFMPRAMAKWVLPVPAGLAMLQGALQHLGEILLLVHEVHVMSELRQVPHPKCVADRLKSTHGRPPVDRSHRSWAAIGPLPTASTAPAEARGYRPRLRTLRK